MDPGPWAQICTHGDNHHHHHHLTNTNVNVNVNININDRIEIEEFDTNCHYAKFQYTATTNSKANKHVNNPWKTRRRKKDRKKKGRYS
jgi:hypothetical protein